MGPTDPLADSGERPRCVIVSGQVLAPFRVALRCRQPRAEPEPAKRYGEAREIPVVCGTVAGLARCGCTV